MSGDGKPTRECNLAEPADVRAAFDAAGIEHLDVDERRTIVVYLSAVLECVVREGQLSAAKKFVVELWEPPATDTGRSGEELLASFVDEVCAALDVSRL